MAYVEARKNENFESLMRRFKKKLDNEGTLKIYKEKQYFKKPSVIAREKIKEYERKKKIEELKIERAKFQHKKKYKKPDRSYKQYDYNEERSESRRD